MWNCELKTRLSDIVHYLTREFRIKLHLKTDIALSAECDIGFCVQFNAEFPRQVINFPIKYTKTYVMWIEQEVHY